MAETRRSAPNVLSKDKDVKSPPSSTPQNGIHVPNPSFSFKSEFALPATLKMPPPHSSFLVAPATPVSPLPGTDPSSKPYAPEPSDPTPATSAPPAASSSAPVTETSNDSDSPATAVALPHPRNKVFSNNGLVRSIVSFVRLETSYIESPKDRQTLLWIALACKPFFEPAMDLLWAQMTSLIPLFRLISGFMRVNDTYIFANLIREQHLRSYNIYAPRVKHLKLGNFAEDISQHVYMALSRLLSKQLLPNLEKLSIPSLQSISSTNLDSLLLLTSPSLKEVSIREIIKSNEVVASSFLYHLSLDAPTISTLSASGRFSLSALQLFGSFSGLEHLHIETEGTTLDASMFEGLSKVTSLKTLYIKIDDNPLSFKVWTTKLERLQTLLLEGPADQITKIVDGVHAPHLGTVSITLHKDSFLWANLGKIQSIDGAPIRAWLQKCVERSEALHTFILDTSRVPVDIPWLTIMPPRPPIHFKRLEFKCGSCSFSSKDLLALCDPAHGWNKLEVLKVTPLLALPGISINGRHPTVSLSSLKNVAKNCANLKTLQLRVDLSGGSDILSSLETQNGFPAAHSLQELELFGPTTRMNNIKQSVVVARYIDRLFPRLQRIVVSDEGSLTSPLSWENLGWGSGIQAMIKSFQEIRDEAAPPTNELVKTTKHSLFT
ncbi:unnamed protein product [Cyclocybe aegerita]|uniref:Uncharacterized protein n=1 Tax=Cyclocybe aegerita TaxID=1973307 RepID=A0A8S0X6Z3_CYCAE|nr:unnamed protein product [Cyclocybe aegerita]